MSLKVIDPNAEEAKKAEYAEKLEDLAQAIRAGAVPPKAMYIHIFQENGNISRIKHVHENFNAFEGIGVFQWTIGELCRDIELRMHGPK